MPTNSCWTGRFSFLSVSDILILLFHPLRALHVGILPFTTNTYKPSTFIFENFAGPLWAIRRTLTVVPSVQHILFAAPILSVGPEPVVVRIGNWRLILLTAPVRHWIRRVLHWQPMGQNRLGLPKLRWESKLQVYRRYQGMVHWAVAARNSELLKRHLKTFVEVC